MQIDLDDHLNLSKRLVLGSVVYFFYPLILFNAWIIANCTLRNNHSISHTNPIITIEILKCIFGIIIVDSFRKIKSEYYLGDVG